MEAITMMELSLKGFLQWDFFLGGGGGGGGGGGARCESPQCIVSNQESKVQRPKSLFTYFCSFYR